MVHRTKLFFDRQKYRAEPLLCCVSGVDMPPYRARCRAFQLLPLAAACSARSAPGTPAPCCTVDKFGVRQQLHRTAPLKAAALGMPLCAVTAGWRGRRLLWRTRPALRLADPVCRLFSATTKLIELGSCCHMAITVRPLRRRRRICASPRDHFSEEHGAAPLSAAARACCVRPAGCDAICRLWLL